MQRKVLALFVFAICVTTTTRQVFPQEGKAESAQTFLVTIVEARLTEPTSESDTSAEALWVVAKDSSKTDWSETIQCTVLGGYKSRLMFGRNVAVVTGVTESPRGATRNMVDRPTGTEVSLAVTPSSDRLVLEIEYQSSRLSGENDGELPPPNVETNRYTSSVIVDLGEPVLLASTPNSKLLVLINSSPN